ncbi:MAG TPA: TolC family protein [archaeon]|nr:TolC family protein [archaeon]
MRFSISTLCCGFSVLLTVLFLGPPNLPAATSDGPAPSALLEAPVPFFHTYNLTSLFPVGKGVIGATGKNQPGSSNVLTLDECINRALGQNPDHGKSRQNLRANTADLLSAWGNYMPTMSASYSISQNNQTRAFLDPSGVLRLTGGIAKSTYANLNINFTVFDRAAKYFEMKNAAYLCKERRSNLRDSELALVQQVRSAYFNALRQEKLLVSAQNQAEQRRDQLKLAEARFSVGSVTKLDVLQAQIELKNQELFILQYENDLKNAKIELNRLMGGTLDSDFDLLDEYAVKAVDFDVVQLVTEAVENHPQVKSLAYRIKQENTRLWMGRLAYLPTLGTSAGYQRSEDGIIFIPELNKGRGLRLWMNWNIIDSFDRFRQNRYTEVTVNNLRYDLASARLNIEKGVRQYYLELLRLYQRNQTLAESKELASQSLELERERYRLGSSSILELRKAQLDYSDAEVSYINSIYDFHAALSSLSRNVGRDLILE